MNDGTAANAPRQGATSMRRTKRAAAVFSDPTCAIYGRGGAASHA
jgi:hypothetical protein